MLIELYVENFALIETLRVDFTAGLNVITGETGAGKSLVIDAVGLLMGGRASQDYIRKGADKSLVQGVFNLSDTSEAVNRLKEAGLEPEDETIVLSREVLRNGKNVCRINFRTVPLSLFREISRSLINIHGQHEHITLLEENNQLHLLDCYGGESLLDLKAKVSASFHRMKKAENELQRLVEEIKDGEKKRDFIRYQLKEIQEAALLPTEDDELEKERKRLQNAEKLSRESRSAYEKLYGSSQPGAVDFIGEALNILKGLSSMDEKIQETVDQLSEVYYLLEDITGTVHDYCEQVISDPSRLEIVENRLMQINKLKKKYGAAISDILSCQDQLEKELTELDHHEEKMETLKNLVSKEKSEFTRSSGELTNLRKKAAEKLSHAVTGELKQLHMPNARFLVDITRRPESPSGTDSIQFLISANAGEDFKPVARTASGGEMSRIMLGIKVVFAQLDQISALIFDEIDSGLGGRAVYRVAEKLELISRCTQVICVTHSPVVASFADNHLHITKELAAGRTVTKIIKLNEEQILNELCRMLAGDNASETTLAQAAELLKTAKTRE